jgi:copper type II ascorbate-dependent monooxygenase-like protein
MHLRGVDIRVTLDPGTPNEKLLLHIPHWDFHWQDAYYLQQPVDAGPGDTVRVSCRFDNASDRRYVLWGEGTTDEMCLGILQIANR